MKLTSLETFRFRSLGDVTLLLEDLNLLIGANASGKSNFLDALRFLSEGLRDGDFAPAVYSRGGIVHLAWKGETAEEITLKTEFSEGDRQVVWSIRLKKHGYDFSIAEERVQRTGDRHRLEDVLTARDGEGSWTSEAGKVRLRVPITGCALAAAAADESFPARALADFIRKWAFFDPDPQLIRRPGPWTDKGTSLDALGRNLAARLYSIKETESSVFTQIISATRSVLGVVENIEPRRSGEEEEERFYFVQYETGLSYPVHQIGASAGTLRMLALMTCLYADPDVSLVGIEEPENYVHPAALSAFAEHLRNASGRTQVIVTTHSPLLLTALDTPEAVCVVTRTEKGTSVLREANPEAVRTALNESGFGLGEFYETKGFGA